MSALQNSQAITTAPTLICRHTEHPPRATQSSEGAESFCQCIEKHVIGRFMMRIEAEEEQLRQLETTIVRLSRDQSIISDELRSRVNRASAVLRRARSAFRCSGVSTGDAIGEGGAWGVPEDGEEEVGAGRGNGADGVGQRGV